MTIYESGPCMIKSDSELMNRSFTNYEAFKRDVSPEDSKADFQKFLGKL